MAARLEGRLIGLPSEQGRLLFSFLWSASWFPCTVPGGVKGRCWAPLFVRPVDTRWSPGDAGWFLPCFSDSHKWEKLLRRDPSPRTWEWHLLGDGSFVHPQKSCTFPYQVPGGSTVWGKGVLVQHPMQLVPKRKGSKDLRIATELEGLWLTLQPNPRLVMRPDSLTPNLDFIFQARICLEISPISYSNSHHLRIWEGSHGKLLGFFCR